MPGGVETVHRAIRDTIECTLREHSIVMNRSCAAFGLEFLPQFTAPFGYNRMYAPRTFYCHESQLRCFPLLAQLLLLIDWRSLRGALQTDFRVNTKSVCRTPRVNCCIEKCTKKEKSFCKKALQFCRAYFILLSAVT